MRAAWTPSDTRDEVVDFTHRWSEATEIPAYRMVTWAGVSISKFYEWRKRYGKANEHNALVPRDHWVEDEEKEKIVSYFQAHPLEGYRRLPFMMLDDNVVAMSPSTVYRVLKARGLLNPWNRKPSKKGLGFSQPTRPHQHWHIDMTYLNLAGTFYFLCSILDGYSRFIVHWEIREQMTAKDVEVILQRARERFPNQKPRIISDNGPQFIAKDLKAFIRMAGMTHVRTSPYYPQSNGKKERWYKTLKHESLRKHCPRDLEEARRVVDDFVTYYNETRLHSALGYVAPRAKLDGRENDVYAERDRKLEAARAARKAKREARRIAQASHTAKAQPA